MIGRNAGKVTVSEKTKMSFVLSKEEEDADLYLYLTASAGEVRGMRIRRLIRLGWRSEHGLSLAAFADATSFVSQPPVKVPIRMVGAKVAAYGLPLEPNFETDME